MHVDFIIVFSLVVLYVCSVIFKEIHQFLKPGKIWYQLNLHDTKELDDYSHDHYIGQFETYKKILQQPIALSTKVKIYFYDPWNFIDFAFCLFNTLYVMFTMIIILSESTSKIVLETHKCIYISAVVFSSFRVVHILTKFMIICSAVDATLQIIIDAFQRLPPANG